MTSCSDSESRLLSAGTVGSGVLDAALRLVEVVRAFCSFLVGFEVSAQNETSENSKIAPSVAASSRATWV